MSSNRTGSKIQEDHPSRRADSIAGRRPMGVPGRGGGLGSSLHADAALSK